MMFQPSPAQIVDALAHAAAEQPREACGVIAGGRFHAVTNHATDADAFVMDLKTYVALERSIGVEAIVHSHVYGPPMPSDADRAGCEKSAKPWLIVSWPTGAHHVIEPCGYRAPLVGRKWAWGTHDCFGLIRDGMQELAGVEIPDFDREWMWWDRGGDIIAGQFRLAGFEEVSGPWAHCDVIGMQIRASVVNHVGLVLSPDVILHQMLGRNSVREVYGGLWQMATRLHLRHRDLMT